MKPEYRSGAPVSWRLAWQFARPEMRGSVARFRVFLAALMLGVAAIGAVGSIAASMRAGIAENARSLLGGDFELSSQHTPPDSALIAELSSLGQSSDVIQMRAMLNTVDGRRKLVELKAVDNAWPLVGQVELSDGLTLETALSDNNIVIDEALGRALGLMIGDKVRLGDATLRISAFLLYEPDRSISFISFGPRVLVNMDTLTATALKRPGAFITYRSRFILPEQTISAGREARITEALTDTHVRLRTTANAAPGIKRFITRGELFLTLVGLTALLIGGLGVGGAVRAWMTSRMYVIATLKCLGASSALIFRVYIMQVMAMAAIGVIGGLLLAIASPALAQFLLGDYAGVTLVKGIYIRPLFVAACFGLLTTFVFAVWPLAQTRHIRAAFLFRTRVMLPSKWPGLGAVLAVAAGSLALLGLALMATGNIALSLSFMGGTFASLLLLAGLAEVVLAALRRVRSPAYVPIRIGLSAITRAGSPLRAIVISFGLGLSVLVTVTLSQFNLTSQLNSQAADTAPDWFFIDIQPDQITPFLALAETTGGSKTQVNKTPMLRGRVTAVKGISSADIDPPEGTAWILNGDRALTWSPEPPQGVEIIEGEWWDKDYRGPPLVSVSHDMFVDFDLSLGDTIGLNILGRDITMTIASTRQITWESFNINFLFIASPGLVDKAPHSWLATTLSDDDKTASEIEQAISTTFSNISAISVKEAVGKAVEILTLLGQAIQITALVTMISGMAVLAGTVAISESQRLSDSIILKTLGATRRDIMLAWLFEYCLLGLLTALVACLIGTTASWALISLFLKAEFIFDTQTVIFTAFLGSGATTLLGLIGALRSLSQKPGPYLRETL